MRVLIAGATGAVGSRLVSLLVEAGHQVTGLTRISAKAAEIERAGATPAVADALDGQLVRKLVLGARPEVVIHEMTALANASDLTHFDRSFACLAPGGLLVGYGSQTMAVGRESLIAAGVGLARLKLWSTLSFLFGGRSAVFYSVTARRSTHLEEFKADMATLFQLLRAGAIRPVVIEQLPLAAASEVHARIDRGGLGGKIVLLPWSA